jgi:sugar phosphate isomerase/epimerase
MRISLHHLSVTDTTHDELVDIAAGLGCDHVCLFLKIPGPQLVALPRVESLQAARKLKGRLDASGLSVWNVDTFMIQPGVALADYAETLDIAAELGAKTLNALNLHPDPASAAEILADFADRAATVRLSVVLEWYRFSRTTTLGGAVELVRRAARPNIKLNVDVLHLMRNGDAPEDLAAVDPSLMRYAQICDGPLQRPVDLQMSEALCDRNFPGEGEFPLLSFVRHLPADAILSIEAPVDRLRPSLSPRARAERAVAGTRRILAVAAHGGRI